MKAEGPQHERETIIRFDEESDQAEIWTASAVVYRRLMKRLGQAYLVKDGQRHAEFEFPKKWLVLPRKRTPKASGTQTTDRIAPNHSPEGGSKPKIGVF